MNRPHVIGRTRIAIVIAAILGLIFPASIAANTNEPIAETGGMTMSLPMLGSPLTVAVTLDAVGHIESVTLDPVGGFTPSKSGEHAVKFENADGTAKVSVKAKGHKLSIKARASLESLVGEHTWSADVFGPGTSSSVPYTIGQDGEGRPVLTVGTPVTSGGVVAEVSQPKPDDDDSARAKVTFSLDGYVKRLTIALEVGEDGDASLKVTLSGKDRQKLEASLAELVGPRTWSAHLCDGTPVTVDFHVTPEGTVVFDAAGGAPVTTRKTPHGFSVRFDGTKVGVSVSLKADEDGDYRLKVDGKSGKCRHDRGHDDDKGRGDHDKSEKRRGDGAGRGDNDKSEKRRGSKDGN